MLVSHEYFMNLAITVWLSAPVYLHCSVIYSEVDNWTRDFILPVFKLEASFLEIPTET